VSELRATFRLQLTAEFGFADARALVPYLRDLGISHLYLSPSLQARSGSTHGYDVVDPSKLSEALGGQGEFDLLAEACRDAGMGIILDVVPNHMSASDENRFWADPQLRERFFDIDPVSGRWRRFFDIDDLAAIRQEVPEVFEATHELLLSLVSRGLVDGLRVDHPDGLADPAGYLARLREGGAARLWVEKILDPGEKLRDWPVSGTVGYEFLNDVCALFVDRSAQDAFTSLWQTVSGDSRGFGEVAQEAKREQAQGTFAPEVERLMRLEPPVDRAALEQALASLPVYRTYVEPGSGLVTDEDRSALAGVDAALREVLLLDRPAAPELVTRFQQTTPAIMAKGVEDTAFYRYARLLALNDVGGDPGRFGITVDQFHDACLERVERFPEALLTTQTHDAKRSADVRARIAALSWMPNDWREHVERWFAVTEDLLDAGDGPDRVERYFIFQTLAGAWPIEQERVEAYMEKALREAKRNTNWVDQNTEWEDAVRRFCGALYAHEEFLADFEPFVERLSVLGDRVALGQLVLKLTAPGIPDIYQGDELSFRALVDPDNRRPVDWDWHQAMLRRLMGGSPPDAETMKMFVTLRLLGLRARNPEPFVAGAYEPLDAGPECCAYLRGDRVLVVVLLGAEARGARLSSAPPGRWRDVLAGEERSFDDGDPVAQLLGERNFGVFERL
jgi:(1->4)-alpha-D-glucan 1-alpha-D-glucosylmutase